MRGAVVSLGGTVSIILSATMACAQFNMPAAKPLTGEQQFQRQCSTCHTLDAAEPQRQGPTLAHVYGRQAGRIKGYQYSAGFAKADWTWDESHLDTWITNPQAMIPGAVMPYHQGKPEVRAAIIGYLKGLH